jgi:cytochrome c
VALLELRKNGFALLAFMFVAVAGIAGGAASSIMWYSHRQADAIARALTNGEPSRAPEIIRLYGCGGCHTISGIPGADGLVGAPLTDLKRRVYVGGVVFNSPENLVRWIVRPQAFSEHSAMPATGISEEEARDVAAYLYAQ